MKKHKYEVEALPDTCTGCDFWGIDMKTCEIGICGLTWNEKRLDGTEDESCMEDCPLVEKEE